MSRLTVAAGVLLAALLLPGLAWAELETILILKGECTGDVFAGGTCTNLTTEHFPDRKPAPEPTETVLLNAEFAADAGDFEYVDGAFRGAGNLQWSDGAHDSASASLVVHLGGVDHDDTVEIMSGGWAADFELEADADLEIVVHMTGIHAGEFDPGEDLIGLVSLDGQEIGGELFDIEGNGGPNGQPPDVVGPMSATIDVRGVAAGTHTVTVGGLLTGKTQDVEASEIQIHRVTVVAR